MILLRTLAVLEFTGNDAGQFLHNQLSADIAGLPSGGSGFACCCNPAGRVLGLLLVSVQNDSILAICAGELALPLREWLNRFVIRADVDIKPRSDLAVIAGVPESLAAGIQIETDFGLKYVIVPAQNLQDDADNALERKWRTAELKSGVTWLGAGTGGQFLPQMLGFESIGALSFKKGCYPGQEIIARTRYLGKLKRRPMLIRISDAVPVSIMEKIELKDGDETHTAVVVDRVTGHQQDQFLFTVVRAGQEVQPEGVLIRERFFESLGF
jgi:folate-binding protein YgfZ